MYFSLQLAHEGKHDSVEGKLACSQHCCRDNCHSYTGEDEPDDIAVVVIVVESCDMDISTPVSSSTLASHANAKTLCPPVSNDPFERGE